VAIALLLTLGVSGCGNQIGGGQTDARKAALQTPEEMALLAFLNDQHFIKADTLDVDCSIRSDAARNIILHRDGPDGWVGNSDDNLFGSIEELDSVAQVGPWTIEQLIICADSHGYMPTDEEVALLNFLNDSPNTTFHRLDVDCGLYADSARNLIAHRDGPDGIDGTADDNPFHSLAEVDGVERVGPATLNALQACAEAYRYDKKNHTPPSLLTTGAALDRAKECIADFVREDRLHRPDWQAQLSYATTWEDAVYWGVLDYIDNFGDSTYCVDTDITDLGTYYDFFGRSAFDLWTIVHVDKASGDCTYIYIEID
jgi:hypothetical protein